MKTDPNKTTPQPSPSEPRYDSPCSALSNDVARCNGVGSDDPEEGWREGCETCLRRTAPRTGRCWMMEPPAIIAFDCEFLIEPNA